MTSTQHIARTAVEKAARKLASRAYSTAMANEQKYLPVAEQLLTTRGTTLAVEELLADMMLNDLQPLPLCERPNIPA